MPVETATPTPNAALAARPGARRVRTILGVRTCDTGIQGPENLILALGSELLALGVRYIVVNLWDGDPPTVELDSEARGRGLESYIIGTSWGMNPVVVPRLASLIRRLRPEVVHTHDVKAEFAALAAARLTGVSLVGSYYGRLAMASRVLQLADLSRFLTFRAFDHVLANSRAQRDELLRFRVPRQRVTIVPSFVHTRALRPPTPDERAGARAALRIPVDRPVLATVARLSQNKGHRYLLEALPSIRAQVPDLLYVISGEGDDPARGEGGLRATLEQQVRTLGLTDHVRFLGYYPDVRTVLHAADLLVSPSLREGMQVAVLEAMAAGLPIVATAIGGTPDAVEDGQTGLLVPPANPAALAAAVAALLTDRARLRRLGQAGRRRAEAHFDTQVVAAGLLALCEKVVTHA
jgi:glycosyltransferase involved in cell wall biosynthesis